MIKLDKDKIVRNKMLEGRVKSIWNPKMRPYIKGIKIYGKKWKTHIINEESTLKALEDVANKIREIIQNEESILFVGTKASSNKQLSVFCEEFMDKEKYSERGLRFSYVVYRWIGGTITNSKNIINQIKKFNKLWLEINSKDIALKSRKEQTRMFKEFNKKQRIYYGLRNLRRTPQNLFVIDTFLENIAVTEAKQKNVFVVGTVNTNADPEKVDLPIPMNDEDSTSISFLLDYLRSIIKDEIIEIRAKNENLTKEEYLEHLKQQASLFNENTSPSAENKVKKVVSPEKETITSTNKKDWLIETESEKLVIKPKKKKTSTETKEK